MAALRTLLAVVLLTLVGIRTAQAEAVPTAVPASRTGSDSAGSDSAGSDSAGAYPADAKSLSTLAERSHYQRTGRYDEVIALCAAYAAHYPQTVRCETYGHSPEGRPMLALVAAHDGAWTAAAAQAQHKPVLLVQGGIHAGEIDGKDAGFKLLHALLEGRLNAPPYGHPLDRATLVFIPVFNVDGHERFGAWNRPNQVGPAEMGWRTTAQNYNLNRDYAKADAPEMQALLRYYDTWDPILYVDLHVTDGAQFQHDVSIQVEPRRLGDDELRRSGQALQDAVLDQLRRHGSLPLPFYPSFVRNDDPSSGFEDTAWPPRFSTGYSPLRNRYAMLVETHSWKDYATRVNITYNSLCAVLAETATHGQDWLAIAQRADARAAQLAGHAEPLRYQASAQVRMIDFLGYAYTRSPSAISGGLVTHYDPSRPQIWHLPLRDDIQPSLSIAAPGVGYLVPPAHAAWLGEKLRLHGIRYEVLTQAQAQRAVRSFRARAVHFAGRPFEGHQTAEFEGQWQDETRNIEAGSLLVPIAQAKARLLMALLEPQAPDSYAAWGFFNNAFEAKEYMEAYVAEEVAKKMLDEDSELAQRFAEKLAEEPAFAADPQARLAFFADRHPSHDERLNLYPILRLER